MSEDEFAKIIAQAANLPGDQQIDFMISKGIPEDEMDDALATLQALVDADTVGDENISDKEPHDAAERLASDAEDDIEQKAQNMADEDETEVTVTKEDSDGDGDVDKAEITKESPEEDSGFSSAAEFFAKLIENDKPHDEELNDEGNSTNSLAQTISNFRF